MTPRAHSVLGAEAWTPWLSGLSPSGVCGTERWVGWQLSWLRAPGTLCRQLLVALVCLSPKDASAQTCIQGGFLTPGNFFFFCELSFIWGKKRAASWEAAPQIALRGRSKETVGEVNT